MRERRDSPVWVAENPPGPDPSYQTPNTPLPVPEFGLVVDQPRSRQRSSFATIIAFASQSRPRHPRHWIKGAPPPASTNERTNEPAKPRDQRGCRGGNSIMAFSLWIYAIQISPSRKLLDILLSSVQPLPLFSPVVHGVWRTLACFNFHRHNGRRFACSNLCRVLWEAHFLFWSTFFEISFAFGFAWYLFRIFFGIFSVCHRSRTSYRGFINWFSEFL